MKINPCTIRNKYIYLKADSRTGHPGVNEPDRIGA